MAVGDVTEKLFLQSNMTTTASDTSVTNQSASFRSIISNVIVTAQSTNTVSRNVTMYFDGTASTNEAINVSVQGTGVVEPKNVLFNTPVVLTGTEAIYFKQDAGSDVNVIVTGTEEEIA